MTVKIKKKNKEGGKKANFLKTGKDKRAAMKAEEIKAKQREEQRDKLWRFRIPGDRLEDTFKITFLDGDLDGNNDLDNPVYYEHSVKINGRWSNFVSCCDEEPDPLQEQGQEPYLAQVFTVIDHTKYESDDGKVYKNRKKLFVATRQTIKRLQKIANKRKGLRGCTFEVSRTTNKSPAVGDVFEFVKKRPIKKLRKILLKQGVKKDELDALVQPADYKKELTYYSRKDIIKMGLAEKRKTISTSSDDDSIDDVDDEL